MKINNQVHQISNGNPGNKSLFMYEKPILKIPQNEQFIFFTFNEEIQSLEAHFVNEETKISEQYKIGSYPIEMCYNMECHTELSIDNCFYLVNKNKIEFYCEKCSQDKISIVKLPILANISFNNKKIIELLKSYLERNKKSSNSNSVKEMGALIKFTELFLILFDIFNEKEEFNKRALFIQNYLDNLFLYLEIVNKLKMENLYLFLRNMVVFVATEKNKNILMNFADYYSRYAKKFNVSQIQFFILDDIFKQHHEIYSKMIKNEIKMDNFSQNTLLLQMKFDFNSIKKKVSDNKISWLQMEMNIDALKQKIINFLRTYYNSYNYISSKKVLERKFINEILFILFKYHHQSFESIKETDNIIHAIQKELSNIIKFLDKSKDEAAFELLEKIKKENAYLENKKQNKKDNKKNRGSFQKNSVKQENNSEKRISLTDEEKSILMEYSLSNTEDSYTVIYASKLKNPKGITADKLQVIIEFLFFIRDKTIDTIHLLNETVVLFFHFLNKNSLDKQAGQKEGIQINNNKEEDFYDDDDDNYYIEELKKDFNIKYSKNSKLENKKIFKNISIQPTNQIRCVSALDYIFKSINNNNEDYTNEINYLYENVVLPERNRIQPVTQLNNEEEENYWLGLKSNIYSEFDKFNYKFKNDPMYDSIINYLKQYVNSKRKDKIPTTPNEIQFYEDYVDNFKNFKELFVMHEEVEKYINIIDQQNKVLKKLQLIKKKYKYIQKKMQDYLNTNIENYSQYYEEWKIKETKFVLKNYKYDELLTDLNKLIPENEIMKISGKDKKNFTLILYMFQKDYFLKDFL